MVFLVCRSRCPEPVDRIPGGELGEDPETGKKEKKLIFVDCYTSWCGPCKMLAKNVFTQDKVADFIILNLSVSKWIWKRRGTGIGQKV